VLVGQLKVLRRMKTYKTQTTGCLGVASLLGVLLVAIVKRGVLVLSESCRNEQ